MRMESCSSTAAVSGIDQDQSRQYVMCDTDRNNITYYYENNEEWKAENIKTIHQDQGAESQAFVHDKHTNAAGQLHFTSVVKVENGTSLCENMDDWKMVRQRST